MEVSNINDLPIENLSTEELSTKKLSTEKLSNHDMSQRGDALTAIHWPALVKLAGSAELLYLSNADDWLALARLNRAHFTEADQLLDSQGQRYQILAAGAEPFYAEIDVWDPLPTLLPQTPLPLEEFIQWVQHHANALGNCCVTKLSFNTLSQGMEIVRSLND